MASPKTVIVTGASRGIGLAAARYLLKQKHNIVAVARSREPLQKLQSEFPGQVAIIAGDLGDLSLNLGQEAVDLGISTYGQLNALIVNHGIKAALPSLRRTKGNILLVSSGAAVGAYATWGAYGASKAVLNHVAMTLATEEPDVTTTSIRPGVVDTEMQRELRETHHTVMDKKDAEKFATLKSGGKLLTPEQPGHVLAKLAIDSPKELSGKFCNWNDETLAAFQ
ncbi:NAD(P)-binding protein [Venturia nashicola]|uniref:NAD(P)-binding protein n=1 Tax=Venturia nashicola TaxID=86259 RepID=A0A4Z1P886_9PEZI|nr:NAD(P)-binding protein [Venturia nashicola]